MTPDEFLSAANVSRETLDRLIGFVGLLKKWQDSVNLVGVRTLDEVWRRHIFDSAQLYRWLPSSSCRLIDLGSGAGFPGLVLAIMGMSGVELIEANSRKCAFLEEAARVTQTSVVIHNKRIEATTIGIADVITARALAPLPRLLEYAEPFIGHNTTCLFLKGRKYFGELTAVQKTWKMGVTTIPSLSGPDGKILCLRTLTRNHGATGLNSV